MGLQLEFYAGDPDPIGTAFSDGAFDGLRGGSLAHSYADLSLHISPSDLDLLCEQAGIMLGQPPVLLLDSLEHSIGGTPDESDASIVSHEWTSFIAAIPNGRIEQLTRDWMQAIADESGEEVVNDSPEARIAVASLVALCREALDRGTTVVFAWYL